MNSIYHDLFYSYGESVLNQLEEHYHAEEILNHLKELPIDRKTQLLLEEFFYTCYGSWSADAFALGLHLGLSLFHNDVRRPRSQQVD